MTILLPTLAAAFAAFCVWLTVRIVNRKERWAKWTLAAVVGVPVLYVASFGPAHWYVNSRPIRFQTLHQIMAFYSPLRWIAEGAPLIDRTIHGYVDLWSPETPIVRNAASLKLKTPSKNDAVPPW